MSADVKETLDVIECVKQFAAKIEAAAPDGISATEAIQIGIEMMGPIGEAINGAGDIMAEFHGMSHDDQHLVGGEALCALYSLLKGLGKLV